MKFLNVTVLPLRILEWFLEFRKIWSYLPYWHDTHLLNQPGNNRLLLDVYVSSRIKPLYVVWSLSWNGTCVLELQWYYSPVLCLEKELHERPPRHSHRIVDIHLKKLLKWSHDPRLLITWFSNCHPSLASVYKMRRLFGTMAKITHLLILLLFNDSVLNAGTGR
jgi:hypothetical protein